MSVRQTPIGDEWQLGPEPETDEGLRITVLREPAPQQDLSASRLERPLHVITVENLTWVTIAGWTLFSRFAGLGGCPLGSTEAQQALFEYDLANATHYAAAAGYHPSWSGWIHLAEAGLFAIAGAGDFGARVVFVVSGLLMVAIAFAMRRDIGRAGAIALALLIAISPSFTYFSRTSATALPAAAMAMVTIAAFVRLRERAGFWRAFALGCATGLMVAADPAGVVIAATFVVVLALIGFYELLFTDGTYVHAQAWLEQHGALMLVTIITAAVLWVGSQLTLFRLGDLGRSLAVFSNEVSFGAFMAGLRFYAPGLVLYEFFILAATLTAVIAITSMGAWSRSAFFFLLWTIISFFYFVWSSEHEPDRIVEILLPAVFLAAIGLDCMHRAGAWRAIRVALVVLAVCTIYVQILANLVYNAPRASSSPTTRHANLYWGRGATTLQARERLMKIRAQFPATGGTVFNSTAWQPSLRWYLRDFRPSNNANLAGIVVNHSSTAATDSDQEFVATYDFQLEESWMPTLGDTDPASAFRFLLSAANWRPLATLLVSLTVHPPIELAPTLIIPPGQP